MSYRKKVYYFILATVTAACVLLGLARHFLGIGIKGRDFFGRSETETAEDGNLLSGEYKEELSSFTSLDMTGSAADVVFEYGDSYAVSVTYAHGMKPVCSVKDEKLTITQMDAASEHILGVRDTDCIMTVTVPEKAYLARISVMLDVGSITINQLKVNELNIQVGTGNVFCRGISTARAKVESGTGSIKMLGVSFDEMEILSGPGDVTLTSSTSLDGCSMKLSTDLGDVRVFGESFYTRYESKVQGQRSLLIDSDTGNVSVDREKR